MAEDRLRFLLKKRMNNAISPEEDKELERLFISQWVLDEPAEVDWEQLYSARIKPKKVVRFSRYIWAAAAAVILAVSITLVLFNYQERVERTTDEQVALVLDKIPGAQEGAILRVNAGKEFELREQKLKDVVDIINQNDSETVIKTFTITTPKANKYNFTLPDGTQVWLNANSQITFPEQFADNERLITTKGEVYLEVTKSTKPFIISTNGIETKVLGTSLNINGYNPKETFTTLFTGKVAVTNGNTSMELTPGQAVSATLDQLHKYKPHLEKTISWKNNIFYFDNEDIRTILSELERWYDVEFEFADRLNSSKLYSGVIDRNLSLQQALEILNFSTSYKLTISNNKTIHVQTIR